MHEPPGVCGIGERSVHRAPIVPQHQVAGFPAVLVAEAFIGGPVLKVLDELGALIWDHVDHMRGGRSEHQRGTAGAMGPGQWLNFGWSLLPELDLIFAGIGVNAPLRSREAVEHPQPLTAGFSIIRQRFPGCVGVAELGLAAGGRHFECVEHGGFVGNVVRGSVDVSVKRALEVLSAESLVGIEGNREDLRIFESGNGQDLNLAEMAAESDMLLVGDVQPFERQHAMTLKRIQKNSGDLGFSQIIG